jgi:two-component system CheB/CheR fusion protein
MLLVSFEESDALGDVVRRRGGAEPASPSSRRSCRRRSDQLRTTIEQYEASAEELKASNEELQAINEELRSTTEELETSKEELQSTNEELTTVNSELKAKIDEAGEINDDLSNLISSSDIATVFVDPEMRIKRFTPAAAKIFNLIAADVGRSLFDITHRLEYRTLAEDAQAVFSSLKTIEREVQMGDAAPARPAAALPHGENRIGGAVLNFVDVTTLREAEVPADVDRERAALVAETMTDFAIMTMDPDGKLTSWNPGASTSSATASRRRSAGRSRSSSPTPTAPPAFPAASCSTALPQRPRPDERWMRRKDGSIFFASGVSAPLRAGAVRGFAKICRDMTGLRRAEELHEQALMTAQMSEALAVAESEQKNEFLAVMSHELKHPLNLISVNAQLLTTLPEAKRLPAVLRAARTIQRT